MKGCSTSSAVQAANSRALKYELIYYKMRKAVKTGIVHVVDKCTVVLTQLDTWEHLQFVSVLKIHKTNKKTPTPKKTRNR